MIPINYSDPVGLLRLGSNLPVFCYLGPDSVLPLASILAAVVGVILLFWRRLVSLGRKLFGHGRRDQQAGWPGLEDEPANVPGPEEDTGN